MSDVLAYLSAVLHRVSATFMPTEMDDVVSFLRGEAWVAVTSTSHPPSSLRYPLGATRWGPYIPLGIAGSALVSAATSGSRAVLMSFFQGSGFTPVLTVSLVPTEQQQQHVGDEGLPESSTPAQATSADALSAASRKRHRASEAPLSSAGVLDAAISGRFSSPAEAARHACMAAARRWFAAVEEAAAASPAAAAAAGAACGGTAGGVAPLSGAAPRKTRLRRLLILMRCCADNRPAVSTRHAGAMHGSASSAASSAATAGRRHRHGDDPLHLLLHELAALTALYEVRLAATDCVARPAVLLLPEDDSYGGALLKQQLREAVGYRYWVELFVQSEGDGGGGSAGPSDAPRVLGHGDKWQSALRSGAAQRGRHERDEAPLARGCRLAAQWGVLELPASASAADVDAATALQRASVQAQEEALRRHPACFFLRPSNAPLCVFLMEALRRCPVLVRPAVLAHWQSTWTARHSLTDALLAFHTALCPFTASAAASAAPEPAVDLASNANDGGPGSARDTDRPHAATARRGTSTAALQCTADLLDAMLDAAYTLAEDRDAVTPLSPSAFAIEHATLFVLCYEALVHQREGRLRRLPGLVRVLERLYDRHVREGGRDAAAAAGEERVRYAVRHLLPFAPSNFFYERVQQQQQQQLGSAHRDRRGGVREVVAYPMSALTLPLRRMSVAPQLQHATLLSLLPPADSLLELHGAAERLWSVELPACWRRATSAVCGDVEEGKDSAALPRLSAQNFFHPLVPHAVRVLYLLTAHALHAATEAAKQVPVVQLQLVCQLSDAQLLLVLKELQVAGLASTNLRTQTARTLLDAM